MERGLENKKKKKKKTDEVSSHLIGRLWAFPRLLNLYFYPLYSYTFFFRHFTIFFKPMLSMKKIFFFFFAHPLLLLSFAERGETQFCVSISFFSLFLLLSANIYIRNHFGNPFLPINTIEQNVHQKKKIERFKARECIML